MSRSFTMGKVDAARHEKNLWKQRAAYAEKALVRIQQVFDRAEAEDGSPDARPDDALLQDICDIVADWEDAKESAPGNSANLLKSLKIKAFIYPLSDEERTRAEDALDAWLDSDQPVSAGVTAVLDAVASLRDPATQRGHGI